MSASPSSATTGPSLSSPEKPAAGVVYHDDDDGHGNDDDDDDDEGAQVLEAEDAAQFDELGGASPVPEEDAEVDSFFGDDRMSYREFVVEWAATQPHGDEWAGALPPPELWDGSSVGDEREEDWRSVGYRSGDEVEVEDGEPGVVDEEGEQDYVLLYSATEAMAADMDPPDWMDAANDYLLEAYDLAPLQRQDR